MFLMMRHALDDLGYRRYEWQRRRIGDPADLDAAGGRVDVEVAGDADGPAGISSDDGVRNEILAPEAGFQCR
jgi:hypothetical protein